MKNFGLTTTKAPFIEKARQEGQLFIRQPCELYSEENHEAWRALFALLLPQWEKYANRKFKEGIRMLCFNPDRIPKLEEVNEFLWPLTRFEAKAVSGHVPVGIFLESLSRREFPTTITIRDSKKLHYLPEPDIFHDIAGHVPMHTDPLFADVLVKFGSLALQAADRVRSLPKKERKAKLRSNICALARFFWFSIEFGLMKENERLTVYGSGLLSSAGEIEHAITSPWVERRPFQLEWVINQPFAIDRYQHLLFYVDSFEHLFQEVQHLEEWLIQGRLDHVSVGAPSINEKELQLILKEAV